MPTQTVTAQEIEDEMALKPLPNVLPAFVPYPLWTPQDGSLAPSVFGHPTVVNPNRTYEDSTSPSPQTWRQPQGSPKTNPQTGKVEQPVTDWKHKPSTDDPFRMETEPGKVETTDPEGQTDPDTAEEGNPSTPKPESDTQDLCEKNPGILACADVPELDTPEGEIPEDEQELTYEEESLFGGGSCPANRTMTLQSTGQTVTAWDWQSACDHLLPIRAIVMTLAAFSAFLILMPGGSKE